MAATRAAKADGGRGAKRTERRTARRLRAVIDEVKDDIQKNRQELNVQFTRLAQLQVDIDRLNRLLRSGRDR